MYPITQTSAQLPAIQGPTWVPTVTFPANTDTISLTMKICTLPCAVSTGSSMLPLLNAEVSKDRPSSHINVNKFTPVSLLSLICYLKRWYEIHRSEVDLTDRHLAFALLNES